MAAPNPVVPAAPPLQPGRRLLLHLAKNVTETRNRAGLTQAQLAGAADLSRATVHLIEAGAGDPRLSTIVSLADALKIDPLELLGKDLGNLKGGF